MIVDAGDSAKRIPRSRNYPGFPDGINGEELLERLHTQLRNARGSVHSLAVMRLEPAGDGYVVQLPGAMLRARTVFFATGVKDAEPRLPGIAELRRDGLLHQCPICDAFEFTGRRIGVARVLVIERRQAPHVLCELLGPTMIAMSPQAFTLSAFEARGDATYAQSWLARRPDQGGAGVGAGAAFRPVTRIVVPDRG